MIGLFAPLIPRVNEARARLTVLELKPGSQASMKLIE